VQSYIDPQGHYGFRQLCAHRFLRNGLEVTHSALKTLGLFGDIIYHRCAHVKSKAEGALAQVLLQVSIWGQNLKIAYQQFNDLQPPKLSKKQICDRTFQDDPPKHRR